MFEGQTENRKRKDKQTQRKSISYVNFYIG